MGFYVLNILITLRGEDMRITSVLFQMGAMTMAKQTRIEMTPFDLAAMKSIPSRRQKRQERL